MRWGENTETYDLLSYDALFGKQYAYDEAGLKPETQDFRIGGEMTLSGFDTAQIGDAIYLRPRLSIPDQAFDLCVNGQVYSTQWVYAGADELDIQCVMTGFGGASWNESNTLHYDSAQQLLDESGAWPYQTISPEGFVLQEGSALRACDIWKSESPLAPRAQTALTIKGERLQWQPVYGLTRAGQYGVDEEGYLYVTTQRGAQVETAQMTLYVFE